MSTSSNLQTGHVERPVTSFSGRMTDRASVEPCGRRMQSIESIGLPSKLLPFSGAQTQSEMTPHKPTPMTDFMSMCFFMVTKPTPQTSTNPRLRATSQDCDLGAVSRAPFHWALQTGDCQSSRLHFPKMHTNGHK